MKPTQQRIVIEYLKTHKQIVPAFQLNTWLTIKGIKFWVGSELGRRARELAKKKILLRDWEYKDTPSGMRKYRSFYLNPKYKKI